MKKILLPALVLVFAFPAFTQSAQNIEKLSNWDDNTLPNAFYGPTPFYYAGCYGYAANGREYAILGSSGFVHFIDITDPASPVEIAKFEGGSVTVWREMHSYQNYLYAITDNSNEGLIIFDMSDLPNAVTKIQQTTEFFSKAHTLFVDQVTGRLYINGSNQGVQIFDLNQDPGHPTLLANVSLPGGDYVHDMYVDNNIGFACHGFNGLYVWDFTDPTAPVALASLETNGYCHSAWPTEDGKYLLVADEVPRGLPLLMVDISTLQSTPNIDIVKQFSEPLLSVPVDSENVTYHNPYIVGKTAYLSAYMDGLVSFDISDPLNPVRNGFYDTFDNTEYNAYNGCWGAYPFLPSGNILASDIQNGLFVLQRTDLPNAVSTAEPSLEITLFPNPVVEKAVVRINQPGTIDYQIVAVNGEVMDSGALHQKTSTIEMGTLPAGTYFISFKTGNGTVTKEVVKK